GFFGKVFELYVRRSIQRAIPDSDSLARRVYPEFVYPVRGVGDRKSSDVIVIYRDSAIFVEATASRIRMENTAISGDLASFEADIEKIIPTIAKQLTGRISDFRAGLYTIGGLTPREIRRIQPVIATLHSMPESSFTWEYFDQKRREHGLLQE